MNAHLRACLWTHPKPDPAPTETGPLRTFDPATDHTGDVMALVNCPECGRRVSDRAPACSGCGCPIAAPPPAAGPRPWWVGLVFAVYVVLAAFITLGPVALGLLSATQANEPSSAGVSLLITLVFAVVVFGGGASLLVIPIRAVPDPHRRQRIWLPLIGSGMLAAVVFAGFGLAATELAFGSGRSGEPVAVAVLWTIPLVWLLWAGVFWFVSRSTDPLTLNGRVYKTLLAGSVLEFLVAVPMHLIVRQRGECCGGVMTAFGIGVGLIVTVIALGPAVFFLCSRRYKQAYRKR